MTTAVKPELLAPAGTLEKLKWAAAYGADAVYFGLEFGSLRSYAGNFTLDDAAAGLRYLRHRGKKGYITLNIYPYTDEFARIDQLARGLDDMGADALIVADLGVFAELKKLNLRAALHISTQANTTSGQTALAWAALGASRVNLARELSLPQVKEIAQMSQDSIEIEVFVHGAVCFSYSGRCAISDYLTGTKANRGQCKHPCRWQYYLVEEKRPGEFMPVFEDERGLYLFNSKELALFEYLPQLAAAGVRSLKIEGRAKSIHYIATAVSLYRQILDGRTFTKEQALAWLGRVPNRGYSDGFMNGNITPDDYDTAKSTSEGQSRYVGHVAESNGCDANANAILEVRNRIAAGDTLEVLQTTGTITTLTLDDPLQTADGQFVDVANNTMRIKLANTLAPYTLLRKPSDGAPQL